MRHLSLEIEEYTPWLIFSAIIDFFYVMIHQYCQQILMVPLGLLKVDPDPTIL
jgi:hypothetical protein